MKTVLGAAALLGAASAAFAAPVDVLWTRADITPTAERSALIVTGSSGPEALVYQNDVQTGSRFNPGTGGTPAGSGVQHDITFDDVPIPAATLAGATSLDVTRVTVGIRRLAGAPAVDVNLFFSSLTTVVTAPDTSLDTPVAFGTTTSLPAASAAVTQLVTLGDGVTPLFNVPLNSTLFTGFGTFAIGVQLVGADPTGLNGWRVTSGPAANANVFWLFDSDTTPPEGAFLFSNTNPPNPPATFYLVVEGNPIPEPASLSLLAMGGMALLRRRRD